MSGYLRLSEVKFQQSQKVGLVGQIIRQNGGNFIAVRMQYRVSKSVVRGPSNRGTKNLSLKKTGHIQYEIILLMVFKTS